MDCMKGVTTIQNDIQKLIDFGVKYYVESNGNGLYLSMIHTQVIKRKGLNATTLNGYITDVVNVRWAEDSEGKMVYLRIGKTPEKNADPQTNKWTEFNRANKETKAQTEAAFVKYIEARATPEDATKYSPEVTAMAKSFIAMLQEEQQKAA
jgi:hypothetical protein